MWASPEALYFPHYRPAATSNVHGNKVHSTEVQHSNQVLYNITAFLCMLVPSHSNSSQFYLDSLKIPLEGRFGFDMTINVPLQNTSQKKENIKNVNILTTIIEYRLHTKQVIW